MSWTRSEFPSPQTSISCTSFDNELTVTKWYPEVLHFCPYTPLILVGLKSDLRYKKTCIDMLKTQGLTPVTTEQGLAVAQKMGAQYMECSSKEMTGVEEIFERAILTVVANDRKNLEHQATNSGGGNGITFGSGGAHIPGVGVSKKKKRKCILV
jgi:Ras homolog gene family, member A